jgi:TrmH family RNA methyltransferase
MLSRSQVQWVQSLKQKKFRQRYGMFAAAGDKVVHELLQSSWAVHSIYALGPWLDRHADNLAQCGADCTEVSERELNRISFQDSPMEVLAVAPIPASSALPRSGWILALDGIQDPGNLGTLLRTADWFGWGGLMLGNGCADPFSPKVVQASMGSLFHLSLQSGALCDLAADDGRPMFGADLAGTPLSRISLPERGILVIGSEAHGLSAPVRETLQGRLKISGQGSAESLNAAVAGGILMHSIQQALNPIPG